MLVCNLGICGGGWGLKFKADPYTWNSRRDGRKEASHSRLVGGIFNKQGNGPYIWGLTWAATRSLHLLAGILKFIYMEMFMGSSLVYYPDDLNNTYLSQGYISEVAAGADTVGGHAFQGQGRVRSLWLPGSSSWMNLGSQLLHDLPQQRASTNCFPSLGLWLLNFEQVIFFFFFWAGDLKTAKDVAFKWRKDLDYTKKMTSWHDCNRQGKCGS